MDYLRNLNEERRPVLHLNDEIKLDIYLNEERRPGLSLSKEYPKPQSVGEKTSGQHQIFS